MRTLFACLLCFSLPLAAQVPDPGASQDEEAAREKILKAADQLDLMEGNTEATKTAVDGMKASLAKLQDENTALQAQVDALQEAFRKSEEDRAKERQVLVDEVAKLVAQKSPAADRPKRRPSVDETVLTPPPDAPTSGPTNPAENAGAADSSAPAAESPAPTEVPPPKPRKGYAYTVEAGQTLSMICAAYRAEGVNVTVAEVKKANGLTDKSVLRVGQKLFIPKPGA